jgi:hypothetical protein
MDEEEETSVVKKAVLLRFEMGEPDGGGLRSRRATDAPCAKRSSAVANPRPEEPPEMRKVRFVIFILEGDVKIREKEMR